MTEVRVIFRPPGAELIHWISMGGISLFLHTAVFLATILLPRLLHSSGRLSPVYTVDLVSLPSGPSGPPAEGPPPSTAAAAPPAVRPEPAMKIPEKPAKPPATKVVKKRVTPRSSAQKSVPESKPKSDAGEPAPATPAPETRGTAGTAGSPASGSGIPGPAAGISGGPGGGAGFLDDVSFQYGWYLSTISSNLSRNWSPPLKPDLHRTLRAVIHFQIHRDGSLSDIELEQPSGDADLDRAALRAVRDSNPLPPLPYQYGKDFLGVHFFFDLKPD